MTLDRFQKYLDARSPYGQEQLTWPLYGAGLENLGKNGKPVKAAVPSYSEDELLMRIDAVSLCYTDLKEIDAGDTHPRLTGRNLKENPIIPGHEISFTVVAVGKNLQGEYKIGNRFTMQPDIWVDGKSIPFCFGMDGGYRQYAKIGREALHGDAGNYLIPVPNKMTYAAAAITEPWACVEAAYRMRYRTGLSNKGTLWIIGCKSSRSGYELGDLISANNLPNDIICSDIPADLLTQINQVARENNIKVVEKTFNEVINSNLKIDDILVLDCDSEIISSAATKLNKGGIIATYKNGHDVNPVSVDLGRLHYDSIYFVGSDELSLPGAFQKTKPRVNLKPNGIAWILGAGGPMGRMHLQRAIEAKNGPRLVLATELTQERMASMKQFFEPLAKRNSKELIIINPNTEKEKYEKVMSRINDEGGADDIEVMVAVAQVVNDALQYAANNSVINLFAGLKRGVSAEIDNWFIYGPKQVRFVGHSGSALDDQKAVVSRVISGQLKPELSVAAVGGINQIADGIQAMKNWVFPGKIVIYPHVLDFPLTAIGEMEKRIPEIAAYLGEGKTWSLEAERVFLDRELSDE